MAIELQVSSVTALVIDGPKERQVYRGKGDKREASGRLTDAEGRPLSGVAAVVMADPLGMLGEATVLLPDVQAAGLVPGSVIRVEGTTTAKLAGGDYASIRTTVTGERVTPIGLWQDWIAAQGRPQKAGDGRAA
ncbi:hypothetical protein MLP_07410 [Microlunatus phosphovorus NM-1]|uniref:Uncharacterized protein n=1 Tax=Microlunatus phosphovorus (strain ATCC 700054 / DSM 10555 / JCM 9379 / NBRC 101784 / NCIMB 13414 / VKM Ac-1990 / NM-1) TaxID=1032480 RepID=F5XL67_MICPN|nr:hypothetical protein [Microlunatus phosphovorus]BAK33755.1 hypothetical protein MLP_07410 [Microlunatus phosphovorus NM-1]